MSYARWGKDSYIYLYGSDEDTFECDFCLLNNSEITFFYGYDAAIQHVKNHIAAGHLVPDHTIPLLEKEKAEKERINP